jgi:outer membrane lipoprotein-sorting protein
VSFVLALFLLNTACPADSLVAEWAESLETGGIHHVVATQELFWPLTGDRLTRTMELWFSPPNRVRVTYSAPDSQVVIADGEHIWTVVPDNNQTLVQLQDPEASWRETPLGKMLSLESFACSSMTVVDEDAGVTMTCKNVQGQSEFTTISLLLPACGAWPAEAQLVDISGNVTSYHIRLWETGPPTAVDETLFVPTIPDTMEVVHLD